MTAVAYHYTIYNNALGIIKAREIRTSRSADEGCNVWFSTNPVFDEGVRSIARGDGNRTMEIGRDEKAALLGLARFSTDTGILTPYAELVRTGVMVPHVADRHRAFAERYGANTDEWFLFRRNFPLKFCTGAQVYLGGEWVKMTPESLAALSKTLPNGFGITKAQLGRHGFTDIDAAYQAGERPTNDAHTLQTAPLLSERQCLRLIEQVYKRGSRVGKVISEGAKGGHVDPEQYKATEAFFNPSEPRYRWLMDIVAPHVDAAASKFGLGQLRPAEMARVIKYDVGGHFHWHRDASELRGVDGIKRELTVSIQLSPASAYQGGDLAIVGRDGKWACSDRAQGAACLFPAGLDHRAMPVTQGRRVALVMWFD